MNRLYHLQPRVYEPEDVLNHSDQVGLPVGVWEELVEKYPNDNPILVEVGEGVIGRIRPDIELEEDMMRLPMWMWMHLGAPELDMWLSVSMKRVRHVGKVILRARQEITVTGVADPVEMLTHALTGRLANPSWACLTMGAELPLACGIFDVIDLKDSGENAIPYGCILDCDVNLEFIPAMDAFLTPTTPSPDYISPEPTAPFLPPSVITPAVLPGKFVPFSGKAYRLDDKV